jgi:hypothetical protein
MSARTTALLIFLACLVTGSVFALLLDPEGETPAAHAPRAPTAADGEPTVRGEAASAGRHGASDIGRDVGAALDVARRLLGAVRRTLLYALGYREFTGDVDEDICFRDYDYIRTVEQAAAQRWFPPTQRGAYRAARKALRETREHRRRLIEDHRFRAADAARARIAADPRLATYLHATHSEPPFLMCYGTHTPVSDGDRAATASAGGRHASLEALQAKQSSYAGLLATRATLFDQLYAEFLNGYGTSLHLADLAAPYGGRPDLPVGVRSYADGVPLVVWIFEDPEALARHWHGEEWRFPLSRVPDHVGWRDGWVWTHDARGAPDERVSRIQHHLALVSRQLLYWFTRQRNRWRIPPPEQGFFAEGFARWMGGVRMTQEGELRFPGIHLPSLRALQQAVRQFEDHDQPYRVYPLREFVDFGTSHDATVYAVEHWGVSPMVAHDLYTQQAYAFVLFLNEYGQGRYKQGFLRLLDAVLGREPASAQQFAAALRLRDESDWAKLASAFRAFLLEDLAERDLAAYAWDVPPRWR